MQIILSATSALARILLLVVLLLLFGSNSSAVTLVWDASEGADGYKIYWGTEQGIYPNSTDVGDVLQADVSVPTGNYIAATAYNDSGESGYSNEVFYGIESIQPASGGQIITVLIEDPPLINLRLGEDYEMVWSKGKWIIITDQLNAGDVIRYGW